MSRGPFLLAFLLLVGLAPHKPAVAQSVNASPVPAKEKTVLFIGDSLTDGYGVNPEQSYPQVIGRELKATGRAVRVINGSISGSVTADADRRLKWYLKTKPDLLVLALGSNDGLKGTPPDVIKRNLAKAIDAAKSNHIPVLLVGAKIFTNFGPEYREKFEAVFTELAKEKQVAFDPFLLEGVGLERPLMQADGKHPNAKGHEVIGHRLAKIVEKML